MTIRSKFMELMRPGRAAGLLIGGGILVVAFTMNQPAKSQLAADAGDTEEKAEPEAEEILPVEECQTNESLMAVAADLERRKTVVEQKWLALEREREGLKRARSEMEAQLQELEQQRAKLQARMDEWEKRRLEERAKRVTKLAGIMGEMKPAEAAAVIEKTKPELAVDVLLELEKKLAARILARVQTDKAVALTNAMSDGSR